MSADIGTAGAIQAIDLVGWREYLAVDDKTGLMPGKPALYNFIYKFNQTHQLFLPEQNSNSYRFSTNQMSLTGHNPLLA